ncbi:hypothetical protein BSZ35_11170 [Salinibacter sp. 10B]|uniref:T9SS type A sorting domain-containing protein n=1 Tax=Salinibacter sp. 10B TaxID=1923971 RepID=UPI000D2C4406|nr:T9SS type A sorting domain-containing protein [Salinibacter sp. 10B]PQJ35082.1 hypothetical protein BSZ35_11170 [Salinibacter sp. 10B]
MIEGVIVDVDVDASDTLKVGSITVDGGIIQPEQKLSLTSRVLYSDGTLTVNDPGSTSEFTSQNSDALLDVVITGDLKNNRTVNVGNGIINAQGAFSENNGPNGSITLSNGGVLDFDGTFNNNSGASLDIGTGELKLADAFDNSGSFTASASGDQVGLVRFDGGGAPQGLSGDFSGGKSLQSVVVSGSAFVDPADDLTSANSKPVVLADSFIVTDGATWGNDPESADMQYEGFNFSINGTGQFYSNKVSYNNTNSDSGNPVFASGEVFSRVVITGSGTYVRVNEVFTVNDKLTVSSGDQLDLESPGTLTINDDFENNGDFTPGSNNVAFRGQTDTGGGDPSSTSCSGIETDDGDCEQDLIGSGDFSFGPVDIDNNDTRVVLSQADEVANTPVISTLTIDPGNDNSNVQFVLNDSDLDVTGDINNNGSFSAGNKLVSFVGGTTQTLSSPDGFDFGRVRLSNGSDPALELSSSTFSVDSLDIENGRFLVNSGDVLRVRQELRLAGGNSNRVSVDVTNDGRAVLTNTGILEYYDSNDDNTLDGRVRGTLVKRRDFTQGNQWYYTASAVGTSSSTDTVEELWELGQSTNDLWTQGFTGSDAPNASSDNSNVLYYDESADGPADENDNGWTSVGSASDALVPGKGYGIYAYSDENYDGTLEGFPKTIDTDVEPRDQISFDYSADGPGFSVTDNETNDGSVDQAEGWNLLSNPYLTTVDWDDFTRTNLDDVVYVWDPQNDTYATWSTSMQSGTGTGSVLEKGLIAPTQSFFVKANVLDASSVNLEIQDVTTVQADTSTVFLKSKSTEEKPPLVAFDLELESLVRGTSVGFIENTTFGKDPRGDGYKFGLPGKSEPGLALYSVLDNGDALTIQSLPRNLSEEAVVPMDALATGCRADDTAFGGDATISWPKLRNIPADWNLKLVDTETGDQFDLQNQSTSQYTFSLPSEMTDSECEELSTSSKSATESARAPSGPTVLNVASSKEGAKSSVDARFELHVDPNGALPVEMTNFTGETDNQQVVLSWTTASEQNNAGFQIQHKRDESGASFTDLTFIEGAGTTQETTEYQFRTENELDPGSHTFRLKQVDTDGATSFTDPITVDVGLSGAYRLSSYPNPVRRQATVEFALKQKGPVTVAMYNTLGQRVKTLYDGRVKAETTKRLQVEAEDLSSGLYFLRMEGSGVSATKRVMVVR